MAADDTPNEAQAVFKVAAASTVSREGGHDFRMIYYEALFLPTCADCGTIIYDTLNPLVYYDPRTKQNSLTLPPCTTN